MLSVLTTRTPTCHTPLDLQHTTTTTVPVCTYALPSLFGVHSTLQLYSYILSSPLRPLSRISAGTEESRIFTHPPETTGQSKEVSEAARSMCSAPLLIYYIIILFLIHRPPHLSHHTLLPCSHRSSSPPPPRRNLRIFLSCSVENSSEYGGTTWTLRIDGKLMDDDKKKHKFSSFLRKMYVVSSVVLWVLWSCFGACWSIKLCSVFIALSSGLASRAVV